VGDVVHGIWGHRSEAVLPATAVRDRVWTGEDALSGTFARVGSIALNAVLAAEARLGDRVAVFGQGVIGLLATRLALLAGADVVAVDGVPRRLETATAMGALAVFAPDVPGGAGAAVRDWSGGGVDSAIELSGNDRALHEAVRSVVVDGTVVASGFYQAGAANLRLGEEFHHNRVRIVASQISGTPAALGSRWDQPRLVRTFMEQVRRGRVDVRSLVTDVVEAADVAAIFERLDRGDPEILQAVLRFPAAPEPA
jgi:threonine dehydrogenase-like Zn-dependent dehydrogenase